MESQNIHIALCVALSVRKSILTNTALSVGAMNAPKRKVHGKLKNVFRRKKQ
jgi:hypothetical protein